MVLDTMLSTLASSIQNGIGARVKKLESFVGGFLVPTANLTLQPASESSVISSMSTTATGAFALGVGLSNGIVTVQTAGIYQLAATLSAVREAAGSATGTLAGYLYINGNSRAYGVNNTRQAEFGENMISLAVTANLKVGDTIALYARAINYAQIVRGNAANNLSVALVARA